MLAWLWRREEAPGTSAAHGSGLRAEERAQGGKETGLSGMAEPVSVDLLVSSPPAIGAMAESRQKLGRIVGSWTCELTV